MDAIRSELKSDREIAITSTFAAPRNLVFDAMTKPEYVRRWYGLKVLRVSVCEIDLRVGGRWRCVLHAPDRSEYQFTGRYREIVRPERFVCTENYEGLPPSHEMLVTVTFNEYDEKTIVTHRSLYRSQTQLNAHLEAGLEAGLRETFERLAALLGTLL